ncbi:MAG: hypothetical protein KJ002_13295 [Candidatus Dadabacteria bacterium]|nr:hypothetical protein [Candidatus Dadabacteria bacterium]
MKKLPSVFRIPQENILALRIKLDVKNAILLSHLYFWSQKNKSKAITVEEKKYSRINYQSIIKALPILEITNKNTLTPRFAALERVGLIERFRALDNTLFVHLTELAHQLYGDAPVQSDQDSPVLSDQDSCPPETRQPCPAKTGQHNEENIEDFVLKESTSVIFDDAKEPEKDFSTSADASVLSLSKDKKPSLRGKEDVGENGDEPCQANNYILPSLVETNKYIVHLNDKERYAFDMSVRWIGRCLNRRPMDSLEDERYCRRVAYRSVRVGATYKFTPELVEAGRLAC